MNSKMAANSQLSKAESKKIKQTKQTTRIGTESQKWIPHGGLSAGRRMGAMEEKVQGLRSTNWQVQNRQGEVKNLYAQPMDRN